MDMHFSHWFRIPNFGGYKYVKYKKKLTWMQHEASKWFFFFFLKKKKLAYYDFSFDLFVYASNCKDYILLITIKKFRYENFIRVLHIIPV